MEVAVGTPLMEATSAPVGERLTLQQPWHSPEDANTRRIITDHMCVCVFYSMMYVSEFFSFCSFNVFNKRKGAGHSQRLPDFIKRIEDALYRNARSMVGTF